MYRIHRDMYTYRDEAVDISELYMHIHIYVRTVCINYVSTHIYLCMYLFDWRKFLLALHGQRAQIRLHVLQEFLHRFGAAGRHLHTHSTLIQL